MAYSKSSNVVSDALAGSSLTLTAAGTASLVVTRDVSQLAKNISSFVTTYNALNNSLSDLKQGELKSGSSVPRIQNQLAQVINSGSGDAFGQGTLSLADLGITTAKNGTLVLNDSKLQAAIKANPDAVARLFYQ